MRGIMNTARLVSFLAAVLITAAQWTAPFWLLAPTRADATPLATAAPYNALPVIVVTAHRSHR
jgi:hypothetical protein